jgi:CheY-like chemotaxis protein
MENKLLIIIVDDDIDDHFLIKQALSETRMAYEVASVYNGLQLLDFLYRKEVYKNIPEIMPDLIFLDINMPILNGFYVLSQLKSNPKFNSIPVYILSTSNSESDKERALTLGATGYYTKPVNYNQLKVIINEVTSNTFSL